MSKKLPSLNNGINCPETQWVKTNSLMNTSVKLADEEAKDRLYEPKHKKKLVRVLTVIAYVFFVSLAAIMLSLYYVFLWNGDKIAPKYAMQRQLQPKCDNIVAEMQKQFSINDEMSPSVTTTTEENTTWPEYDLSSELRSDFEKTSPFLQKLIYNKYPYGEND